MKSSHFFFISMFSIFAISIALYPEIIASQAQNHQAYQSYIKKGHALYNSGQKTKAYRAYLKAYDNAITHVQKKTALGSLAITSLALGKRKESEQYLTELLSIFPDNTWAKQFAAKNNLNVVKLRSANLSEAVAKRDPGGIVDMKSVIENGYKKKHALVIGINAYSNAIPLESAVANATAVLQRLKELNFKVKTLINHEAKKSAIEGELGRLVHTTEDEQVLIYFAGHGVTEHLHNNQLEGYILPVDVNLRNLYATAISMTQLRELTRHIPAKHILYVFDSCYSGLDLTRATTTSTSEYLATLAGKRAVYMITAGKAGEIAREIGQHGIFTLNFLDGIAGAADTNPKDEVVQASELGVYLARVVSKNTKNQQNPQHGLLEGNGDFLFPLQNDDPIRLRKSRLAELERQTLVLTQRQDLQAEFDKIAKRLGEVDIPLENELTKEMEKLDEQIKEKATKLVALSKSLKTSIDLNRSSYSMMAFPNTGIEFNILKTFPNLKKAEEYYSKVFGMEVDLDRGGYQKDEKRIILLSRVPAKLLNAKARLMSEKLFDQEQQLGLSGIIDLVVIQTETISDVLKEIKHIDSALHHDHTTFVKLIYLVIRNIDKKRLTFEQIKKRLIADYGNPTLTREGTFKVIDWRTGKFQLFDEFIWEDNEAGFLLKTVSDKDYFDKEVQKSLIEKNLITPEEYNEWKISTAAINIYLQNNSSVLKSFYEHAYKIAELEEQLIEKKTARIFRLKNF